jgi:hypothetical protein
MATTGWGPPAVDFYNGLSGLGDIIADNRKQAARKAALDAATTDGVSYGDAMRGLIKSGDLQGANMFATLQARKDAQDAAARAEAHQAARDKVTDQHWSASYGLQKRTADRADDPTPTGFAKNADGTFSPLIGGPQDPEYQGRVAAAKAKAEAELPGGGGLSLNPVYGKDAEGNTVLLQPGKNGVAVQSKLPEGVTLNGVDNDTLKADAARLNAGDPNVLKKYSNKGQGRVDLLRLNNEANRQRAEAGQSPIDITQNYITTQGDVARERTSGTMEGRMAPASIEAQGAFKIAQNATDNLWRTNNVPLNRVLQLGETALSNPELKAAKVAINTAVMTYSRAIAPTGVGTVDAQQHAREILDTADGPKATAAAFAQLAREVDMAHASPGIARQYFAAARKARLEGKPMPEMPQYQPAQPAANAAPPEAIAALKQDPRRAADFDAYYGAGSARAVLGGGVP